MTAVESFDPAVNAKYVLSHWWSRVFWPVENGLHHWSVDTPSSNMIPDHTVHNNTDQTDRSEEVLSFGQKVKNFLIVPSEMNSQKFTSSSRGDWTSVNMRTSQGLTLSVSQERLYKNYIYWSCPSIDPINQLLTTPLRMATKFRHLVFEWCVIQVVSLRLTWQTYDQIDFTYVRLIGSFGVVFFLDMTGIHWLCGDGLSR